MPQIENQDFWSFLYSLHHPTYSMGGKEFQWSLDNMYRIDEYMGFPSRKLRYIHVAGTNGKGSTVSLLAAILMKAGYKVGYYRSPQMFDIRERFYINDQMISESDILHYYHKICQYLSLYGASPKDTKGLIISYSEFFISLAFDYFYRKKVDIVVLETGIGGLQDPTNIIKNPELCIITSIGSDHTRLFGNSLLEITHQKCGIIKPHAPVVVGHIIEQDVIDYICQEASKKQAPVILSDEMYSLLPIDERVSCTNDKNREANYQHFNIQTVCCALHELRKKMVISLSSQEMQDAVNHFTQTTGLYGRWQICNTNPIMIADVADNPQAVQLNFAQLEKIYDAKKHRRLVLIFGITSKEKLSIRDFLPRNAIYIITESKGFLTPQQIADVLGVDGYVSTDVNDAMKYYFSIAKSDDLVYIGGSIHIVHDALIYLRSRNSNNVHG